MIWSIKLMDILAILPIFGIIIYYFINRHYKYFSQHGVKTPKVLPFFGNIFKLTTFQIHLKDLIFEYYNQIKGEKYFGFFYGFKPIIVIKDVELLKDIMVKDFDHFTDHFDLSDENDPLLNHGLLSLKGEKWRHMRNTLTPAFTGAKMRDMMSLVQECSEKLIKYLNDATNGYDVKELEIRDVLSKYTCDVIASCAFGIECNTLNDPNNDFFKQNTVLTNVSPTVAIFGQIFLFNPIFKNLMKIKFMDKKNEDYYKSIVMGMINERSKTGFVRKDMIHLLMLAISGKLTNEEKKTNQNENGDFTTYEDMIAKSSIKRSWTEDEIVAQAVFFAFAGQDTMSTLITFMVHALALNPDVQQKLIEEIDDYVKENECMIKNNDIRNLKYMDMVVSESLRLCPPANNLDRVCTKPFSLPPTNEKNRGMKIEKDQLLWIPIYSIHRDPQHYPEPDKFIPERFSDENKDKINPSAYLPFGLGPRQCIGNRFALMEAKVVLFHILANFEIVKTSKTEENIKIIPHVFMLVPKNGINVGFRKRNNILVK